MYNPDKNDLTLLKVNSLVLKTDNDYEVALQNIERVEEVVPNSSATGGWTILKSRPDKDANFSAVAEKVWKTIKNGLSSELLYETLKDEVKAEYFNRNKNKRTRQNSND